MRRDGKEGMPRVAYMAVQCGICILGSCGGDHPRPMHPDAIASPPLVGHRVLEAQCELLDPTSERLAVQEGEGRRLGAKLVAHAAVEEAGEGASEAREGERRPWKAVEGRGRPEMWGDVAPAEEVGQAHRRRRPAVERNAGLLPEAPLFDEARCGEDLLL